MAKSAVIPARLGCLLRDPLLKCCKKRVFEDEAGDVSSNEVLQPL